MVTFLFSGHTITKAEQYAGLEPGRCIFQPGHLTWRALVYRRHCHFQVWFGAGNMEVLVMCLDM